MAARSLYGMLSALLLAVLVGCGGGDSSTQGFAFVINKSSGNIDACQIDGDGHLDFGNCWLASTSAFSQPIDLVTVDGNALITVENGIERCARSGYRLSSCVLAIGDSGFPVALTLQGDSLYIADYSARAITIYDAATLEPVGTKPVPTSPTDVVFANGVGYIVTQDIVGSIVFACNEALENCRAAYSPADRALLAMTIHDGAAFFTNASGNNVISCAIGAGGSLADCSVEGDATVFNYPYGITIHAGFAYVPNRAEATVTVCGLRGRHLVDCAKRTNALFDGPTFLIFE